MVWGLPVRIDLYNRKRMGTKYSIRRCLKCGTSMEVVVEGGKYNYCPKCDKKEYNVKVCCHTGCRACMGVVEK